MNKTEYTKSLEERLTKLLGKESYEPYKKTCTGKYRGYYDYGLRFDDEVTLFVSVEKKYYLRNLLEEIDGYQYFRDNHENLKNLTRQIIERDNQEAIQLGLTPIDFVDIQLRTEWPGYGGYAFWIGLIYDLEGSVREHLNTNFFYACKGISIGSDDPLAYFKDNINRPDKKVPTNGGLEPEDINVILLGCLHKVKKELRG